MINNPKIIVIIKGREIIVSKRKTIPPDKSIQLAKSFGKPKKDLIIKIIPTTIKM